jgi:diacylglycerol kinase family enzyme
MVSLLRGTHGRHRAVTLEECVRASVQSSKGLVVHSDGEIVHENATKIEVMLQRARLRILSRPAAEQ